MKTYLFDFDGTLVDSMPDFVGVMLRILDEHNIKYEKSIVKVITPLGYVGTAKYFHERMGLDRPEAEIIELMHKYAADAYHNRIMLKLSVADVLRELKKRGARLNVLTASPHDMLDPCLKRCGVFELFDNVWSCEDFGTTKSDPKIYEMAAERMGCKVGEALFLDDNPDADRTAKSANMPVCGVYDESSAQYEAEMRELCDFYIKDFAELLKI